MHGTHGKMLSVLFALMFCWEEIGDMRVLGYKGYFSGLAGW
jgi:hypothetical protein